MDPHQTLRALLRALLRLGWQPPENLALAVRAVREFPAEVVDRSYIDAVGGLSLGSFRRLEPEGFRPAVFWEDVRRAAPELPAGGSPPDLSLETTLGWLAQYAAGGSWGPKRVSRGVQDGRGPFGGAPAGGPIVAAERYVNTWIEADHPAPPLRVGRWYPFYLAVGAKLRQAMATPFAEPDFGNRSELELEVSLYSRDLDLEGASGRLRLPRVGASLPFAARLRPRHGGPCRLEIVLSLARELDVLQTLTIGLQATPAPAEVGAARERVQA